MKFVRFETLNGGDLVTNGERMKEKMVIYSATKARRYLHHGCVGYLKYIMERKVDQRQLYIDEVPISRGLYDVFLDDFSGVPPEQQVEFWINIILGTKHITRAPY